MSKEELKILEKQLLHFIKWLADNRPYKEGLLYSDMKDYLFMLVEHFKILNQNEDERI